MQPDVDLLQGTLDLLILKSVSGAPMHGWGISQRIRLNSRGTFDINQGSLYPALHRLVKRGFLQATWGVSDNNRRARFYRLTSVGRRELSRETNMWRRVSAGVDAILAMS